MAAQRGSGLQDHRQVQQRVKALRVGQARG